MKKPIRPALVLIALAGLLLTSCARIEPPPLLPAAPPGTATPEAAVSTPLPLPTEEAAAPVELDLSIMGPGMAYATLYNILFEPASYVGQRLRVSGPYEENIIGQDGFTYRFIVVADRQACCAQGLEFVLADEAAVYPEPGSQVEICGVLESYQEDDQNYVRVVADELRILESPSQTEKQGTLSGV